MKKNLRIVTNLACNHRCAFCYQNHFNGAILAPEELLNEIQYIPSNEIENITVMGGEPLLNVYIEDIITLLREKFPRAFINIDTNGRLLTKNFLENMKNKLDRISVDLGFPFKKISENFRENSEEEMFEILKEFDYDYKFNFVHSCLNESYFEEELKNKINMIKKYIDKDFLITICEDFKNKKPVFTLEEKFDKKEYEKFYIEDKGLIIYKLDDLKLGYFKIDNFSETDLIIFKKNDKINSTINFNIFLGNI